MRQTVDRDSNQLINGVNNPEAIPENTVSIKHATDPGVGFEFGRKYGNIEELELTELDTFTADVGTNVLDVGSDHGLSASDRVRFSTENADNTAVLPAPLKSGRLYFVKTTPASDTLTLSLTDGGPEIDLTTAGTGTHTIYRYDELEYFKFGAKEAGKFDADYIVSNWDGAEYVYEKTGYLDTALYTVNPSFDNDDLNALLNINADPDDDEPYVDLDCEVKWRIAGKRTATLTFTLRIYNDVNKGTEGLGPDPNPEWPESGDIMTFTGLPGALVNKVAVPADSTVAGDPGDFSHDGEYLYIYTGDGVTHSWLKIAGINEF